MKAFDFEYNGKFLSDYGFTICNFGNKGLETISNGSKISFMGIPTPNLFAGGENMHGRFEFVSLQTMEKAVDVIIGIVRK